MLIDLLWPGEALDPARMKLRTALASLRRQLEPPGIPHGSVLLASRLTVQLNPESVTTDVAQFEAALQAACRAPTLAAQLRQVDAALALSTGPLLPGCCESWVLPEQQRLNELLFQTVRRLLAPLEQAGELERALAYAGRAVVADPLREEAQHELIRLYLVAGQPAAARRQYRKLERLLRAELGETPSPATRALLDRPPEGDRAETEAGSRAAPHPRADPSDRRASGRTQEPGETTTTAHAQPAASTPGSAATAAPAAVPQVIRSAWHHPISRPLPLPPTRFFGREAEVARVRQRLVGEGVRLLTLTGPGGTGKTRLALEAAARLREGLEGAVWFVPLADLAEAQRIPDAIHAALGLPRLPQAEPVEQVVAALSPQPSLLVLDNLEHLLPEAAPIVRDLLERIPMLQCLVTSRQILELTPEREIALGPLPVPGVQAFRRSGVQEEHSEGLNARTPEHLNALLQIESLALFVDRAQRANPDFQLTRANAAAVVGLCRRLEGIPLAIELAAARAQRLAPSRMLAELQRRFGLLVSRKRDLPSRHQTLRAAIDWSYTLLPVELQQFFAQLFPFRGGFTIEAAAAVAEASGAPSYLEQLRDSSLVLAENAGPELRYRLLEMLREYGQELLEPSGEAETIRHRHALFFVRLARQAEPELVRSDQAVWLDRLEREHDNLRTALDWLTMSGEAEAGLQLGSVLARFWEARGYFMEGRERLSRLLGLARTQRTEAKAKTLNGAALLARLQRDFASAQALCEESLAIARELNLPEVEWMALHRLAETCLYQDDDAAARAYWEKGLAVCRKAGDQRGTAVMLMCLGVIAGRRGESSDEQTLIEESNAIFRLLGDREGVANTTINLGRVAREQSDHPKAGWLFEQAMAIGRELGNPQIVAASLYNLGLLAERQGELLRAKALFEQSLTIHRESGNVQGASVCLWRLGQIGRVEE